MTVLTWNQANSSWYQIYCYNAPLRLWMIICNLARHWLKKAQSYSCNNSTRPFWWWFEHTRNDLCTEITQNRHLKAILYSFYTYISPLKNFVALLHSKAIKLPALITSHNTFTSLIYKFAKLFTINQDLGWCDKKWKTFQMSVTQ